MRLREYVIVVSRSGQQHKEVAVWLSRKRIRHLAADMFRHFFGGQRAKLINVLQGHFTTAAHSCGQITVTQQNGKRSPLLVETGLAVQDKVTLAQLREAAAEFMERKQEGAHIAPSAVCLECGGSFSLRNPYQRMFHLAGHGQLSPRRGAYRIQEVQR